MSDSQLTLEEWLERVRMNENHIYVREGRRTVALSEVPPDRWAFHIAYWLREGRVPVIYRGL